MTTAPQEHVYDNSALLAEDEGYHKGLKPRQLQMIAIGGAIGTGLFLGAGGRLHNAGPGLFLSYAFCGIFVFLILRALGELVLHRPSSGSFVSYAREFLGEKAAFVAGWMYWLNWAMTAIVDCTAIATYFHYWSGLESVPQFIPHDGPRDVPVNRTDAIGFMGGAQNTNEECYLFQKAARLLGLAYVEHQARL